MSLPNGSLLFGSVCPSGSQRVRLFWVSDTFLLDFFPPHSISPVWPFLMEGINATGALSPAEVDGFTLPAQVFLFS